MTSAVLNRISNDMKYFQETSFVEETSLGEPRLSTYVTR